MKAKLLVLLAAVAVAWLTLAPGFAAEKPEPPAKGDRWEYCEVHFRTTSTRGAPAGWGAAGGPGGAAGQAGGPGAGGKAGAKGAAPGMGAAAARVTRATAKLVTAQEEIEATSWEDLATKLKAPAAKKDATVAVHKMRVLNHLGSQGWELVPAGGSELASSTTLLFKRKVAK